MKNNTKLKKTSPFFLLAFLLLSAGCSSSDDRSVRRPIPPRAVTAPRPHRTQPSRKPHVGPKPEQPKPHLEQPKPQQEELKVVRLGPDGKVVETPRPAAR